MTINEIYEQFLPLKKRQVKESTIATYHNQFHTHILPVFGNVEYEKMKMGDIQQFVYDKLDSGLSLKSVKDLVVDIKMLLNFAMEELELPGLPGRKKIIYPTTDEDFNKPKCQTLSVDEQKKLMAYLLENPSFEHLGIAIVLCTGMRIGEICAIQFSDMDLDEGTISISRTLERITNIETGKTKLSFSTPKTRSSRRTIPLPQKIVKIIKKTSGLVRDDYFLCSGTSKPIEPRVLRNHFNDILSECGIDKIKFHGLRHTFATRMIAENVDVKTASVILGHSDVKITLNTYVHPSDESKRKAIKLANSML